LIQRLLLLAALVLPLAGTADIALADKVSTGDRRVLPPEIREFKSPSGDFVLTLSTSDHWKTRYANASLVEHDGTQSQQRWQQTLPHQHGPRHVLVTNAGAVVLADEWINIPSRRALMLIAPDGKILAQYSLDQLIETLGVSRKDITPNARHGIWLGALPAVSDDGSAVLLEAGGRHLRMSLADGALTVVD